MRKMLAAVAVAALSLTTLTACPKTDAPTSTDPNAGAKGKKAGAAIESRSGSTVTGDVLFEPAGTSGQVKVTVNVKGATPGDHAVHVHEKGDCSAPDAASAGGHFNPAGVPHGAPGAAQHHAGDFGNLTVKADGTGSLSLTVSGLTLDESPTGVVGRALIVHEKVDDFTTQPTGNAGGRQGCAVIRWM